MSNPDEQNGSGGPGNHDAPAEQMSHPALETRVRELERENARLRLEVEALSGQIDRDRQLFDALAVAGVPADQRETEELLATSVSLSHLIEEMDRSEPAK